MAELVFPIAATLALVLVAIPVATMACKAALVLLRPAANDAGVREGGSSGRYLLLVAPVALPALWLVSAAIHHAEAKEAALTCLYDHLSESSCAEPLAIAAGVVLLLLSAFVWRRRLATRAVTACSPVTDPPAERRIERACARHSRRCALRQRIQVVEGDAIRTVGLLRRRVEVGVSLTQTLDAEGLAGALLHEDEHVVGFDPLRFVILSMCQSLNPTSRLLDDEIAHWRAGREAVCDEAAVHHGADPCGLAQALIAVARPRADNGTAAHLGRGGGIHLLRVRVALLMGYATSRPRCHCSRTAPKLAALAIVLFATLPHYLGDDIIVDLHQSTERIAVELGADR